MNCGQYHHPYPMKKIAKMLSCDTQRVRTKAFHMGLARKLGPGGAKEREEQALGLSNQGHAIDQIARRMGITENYVLKLIQYGA